MSTHDIYFCGEIRKNISSLWLEKKKKNLICNYGRSNTKPYCSGEYSFIFLLIFGHGAKRG